MSQPAISIRPFGDAALLASFEERIDPLINAHVHQLAELVEAARNSGAAWGRPVPAYSSLLVPFDPLVVEPQAAEDQLRMLLTDVDTTDQTDDSPLPTLDIQVHYGGEHGPDLAAVADVTGLSQAQVIELHSGRPYRAYFLGFAPGFAYLGTLPGELRLPRRPTPRQRVPAGSVAIAGEQTAAYPLATPGGWHLLGRTELVLWDVRRDPPALISPGQQVRFVPVSD